MQNHLSWILTDVDANVWVDRLELGPTDLGLRGASGVSVRKYTLRGGLSDGVDVIEVKNGAFCFTVLPTRGMGLWRGEYKGRSVGWCSPVHGPVNPKFVHANDRGGLGWLGGFDECIVRCGLENNGGPGTDVVPNNMGQPTEIQLGLHGRIANVPAHYVAVNVIEGERPQIRVVGEVDEAMLFCPQLRLVTEITTEVGSNTIRITDRVVNMKSTPSEMQLLYHCNYGAPFLGEGARLLLPASDTLPRDARAMADIDTWDLYKGPTAGYVEQCYWHVPIGDRNGNTVAMLASADGNLGIAVRYNLKQLPCFTQWKNTAAECDGYVTGLEPATNYPNTRRFERERGRVVTLAPQAEYRVDLVMEVHDNAAGVRGVAKEIEKLQGRTAHTVHPKPVGTYSSIGA